MSSAPISGAMLRDSTRSLWAASLTAAFAAVTHAYIFGPPALAVGVGGVAVLVALGLRHRRTGRPVWLWMYLLLNLWLVLGFGLVGGFWNHVVKVVVLLHHPQGMPPELGGLFIDHVMGTAGNEVAGSLTFLSSIAAAYYARRLLLGTRAGAL